MFKSIRRFFLLSLFTLTMIIISHSPVYADSPESAESAESTESAASAESAASVQTHNLFILSDSTAANYSSTSGSVYSQYGWGMFLSDYLSDDINVHNYALPGRSSRSYINTKSYQNYLSQVSEGDYVLIQFGHNDALITHPKRVTYTNMSMDQLDANGYNQATKRYSFEWYLYEKYIKTALDKGAYPILVTPPTRISTTGNANYTELAPYRSAILKLASKYGVPVIDLGKQTKKVYNKLYSMSAQKLTFSFHLHLSRNTVDYTHFTKSGANLLASIVAQQASAITSNGISNYLETATVDYSRTAYRLMAKESRRPNLNIQVSPNLSYNSDSNYTVRYASSNRSLFTVDQDGVITGKRPGTGYLTATVQVGNGTYIACTKITVR